ncbi:MAG: NADH-quinone oxidoreductase subunit N [Planctomycetota bacterium]|nr:NADH-quinone oxidoreductase subunit N [Planctomycetota bacterium]
MNNAYLDGLASIAPEIVLTVTALGALVLDLVAKGRDSVRVGYLTLAGLAATAWFLFGQWGQPSHTAYGMVAIDQFGNFFKLFSTAALAIVVLFVMHDRRERRHGIGEYYFLLLGALIGIFFMVSTGNLLLMVLGFELLSLSSYSLSGFHKGNRKSAEASMKYVIFGGLSTGIMVYGISLLYGLTGTIDLAKMAGSANLVAQVSSNPIPFGIATVLVLAGFAYKISLAPFHFWTPDVYEGAPTPVTAFLAVASKAAGFGALLRFLGALFLDQGGTPLGEYGTRVGTMLALLAAVTMTLGNLAALRQPSLKRMLAYSSIAHAGYVMIGIACMTRGGFTAAMYYLAAYYFMNLGAFGFLVYFEGVTGSDTVDSLKGMGFKAPLISMVMVAFLVSLTGLPPTVGFYGKYLLFIEGVDNGLMWLVVVAALNSVVSLFYYLRVARALFLSKASDQEAAPAPVLTGFVTVLGVATVAFGLYVTPLQAWATKSLDLIRSATGS